jgi:fused signal recognition particle receptor
MFGKIKGKLSGIFKKHEEELEETADIEEEVQEEIIDSDSSQVSSDEKTDEVEEEPKKKGFLGGFFSKKKESEEEIIEEVEEALLEGVEEEEKKAIKEDIPLPKEEVEDHKKNLEKAIHKEEVLEKETLEDIPKQEDTLEVEHALEQEKKELSEKSIQEDKLETRSERNDVKESAGEERESEVEGDGSSPGFFSRAFSKLKKKKITYDDFEKIWLDLEIFLLEINVAYEIVEKINRALQSKLVDNSFDRFGLSKTIREVMVQEVEDVLSLREGNFLEDMQSLKQEGEPFKIIVLGVNGTGKTTSIGKVIRYLQKHNLSVVVAASDTFRAAAVDQIEKHCENLGVRCIKHSNGSDPAAVAYDAIEHAKAKGIDVVLIDTAGRMPNNANLMMELQKIKRVSKAEMALFIGDSISGNDLIDQISLFNKGVEINGVVLTKVDTDERPGSIVTCAYSINKPIYFLGIGQNYDDLIEFHARDVAEKLFDVEE